MQKNLLIASCIAVLASGCGGGNSGGSSSSATSTSSVAVSSSSLVPSVSSVVASSSVQSSSSAQSSSSIAVSSASSSVGTEPVGALSAACVDLVTNPQTNWNESSIEGDQAIVKCLFDSMGRAIGFGEKATGGYDAAGNSKLVVIKKNTGVLPEKQLLDAISSTEHNWIVFDKDDYKSGGDIAMYRLHCDDAGVLAALGNATTEECLDHTKWCASHNVSGELACNHEFFTVKLNNANLPIRDEMINSNTTLDGRGSHPRILFNGFKVGADASGASTVAATSVIIDHLLFQGAHHAEDHGLDPDLLRITGESHDIWVHKNTFQYSGDSAFDVKVGAYDVTFSFNKIVDVVRTSLHGSDDKRVVNENITTTMHDNLFLTSETFSDTGAPGDKAGDSTGRRTPLIRRGRSHLFNNVFFNYYKEFASIRVGATLLLEDNVFLGSDIIRNRKSNTQAAFDEWLANITKGTLVDGSFASTNGLVSFAVGNCQLDPSFKGMLPASLGVTGRDIKGDYSSATTKAIAANRFDAGQELINYVKATAGHTGELPFNSPLAKTRAEILALPTSPCI